MASDLLHIAVSGARAARSALDVTAQNIANAATAGYVRRSAELAEVSAAGGMFRQGEISLSGVRVAGIERNADAFLQAEARRTGSDSARASHELSALISIETALEQSGTYDAIVEFEASLRQLSADPADGALRAATIAAAGGMAGGFNIAASGLEASSQTLRFEAQVEADAVTLHAAELARVNLKLARAGEGTAERATLLDSRDNLLSEIASRVDIRTSFSATGSATVQLGNDPSSVLVDGNVSGSFSMITNGNGTVDFALDGNAAVIGGGALAGKQLALVSLADARSQLDTLASEIANTVNNAQAAGADLNGNGGQALFSGSDAATLALAVSDGALIATAPAGAPAGSNDAGNLTALRAAFEGAGHAGAASTLLFSVSSDISARKVTSEALTTIAGLAASALDQQAGVDLDAEAANLVRFQQAFQASGRAMQVASNIFDTLLGIGR